VRLGRDKAFEPFDIGNLLEWSLSRLSLFKSDIILVANAEQHFARFTCIDNVRVTHDIYPGKGPLGGIYSGLMASHTINNLVIACDMPFLNIDLLRYMIQLSPGYDLVVPRKGTQFEPLHAVYSKTCLSPITELLVQNKLRVNNLFSLLNVRYIEDAEIVRFDPKRLCFFNINTDADLDKARKLLKADIDK
jgi:molybdopterin-guanine dinucleotide biosynthesis protein A